MELLIILLPLLGSCIAGFFGRKIGDKASQFITSSFLVIAAVTSWVLFFKVISGHLSYTHELFSWVSVSSFHFDWALRIDALTVVMLIVVTTVSSVVHIYSVGYMSHDKSKSRFMSYLSLFTFAMLMLVTSDNLVQMFFGWEGVGLASYLLIGFWYEKPSACAAAMKAFIVNRVGDVGFALGIFGVFLLTNSVQFNHIFSAIPSLQSENMVFLGFSFHALTLVTCLLFIGAMGKSAQLGLHTWLPDAMEGPTPVSALIHAATMVTAGVFMVCRLSPIFEYAQFTLNVIAIIGATTAFFAATVAVTQTDIKRVIAYSTCSQLGYMFAAIGVSAYPAAMFHLMTHAFFKALLFLGAGSVIHAMSDEQDMRKMGGIWRMIPVTYAMMWIGSLALAGIGIPGLFGFAGFYSKDAILEASYAAHTIPGLYAYIMGTLAALLTSFYSGRLLFMTFHGKPRCDDVVLAHVHESPKIMTLPLYVLAAGALFAGILGFHFFVGEGMGEFWSHAILILPTHHAMKEMEDVPLFIKLLPLGCGLLGFLISYVMYMQKLDLPEILARKLHPLYQFSLKKWYFDELYDFLFVRPALALGRLFWKGVDRGTIDYFGPDGFVARTRDLSRFSSLMQTGYLYHYAFTIIIGVVALLTWFVFSGTNIL